MRVVFTDLDGTLLDANDYSFHAAVPALEYLRQHGIPCIIVTSKTRAEVEYWQRALNNNHPFVVENGGAAFVPLNYFPFALPGPVQRDYCVMEWGERYERLTRALDSASRSSQCRVRGFHEMTSSEVAAACSIPLEQAALAKIREYDEPFQILDPARSSPLFASIEQEGLQCTRGGRFWHITGSNDKSVAVRALIALFQKAYGSVETVGLGDSPNDVPFLRTVDAPIVIPSPASAEILDLIPNAILAPSPGPRGWNDALLAHKWFQSDRP